MIKAVENHLNQGGALMAIKFKKADKTFILTTKNTAYVFSVSCDRYLVHQYYGKKTAKWKRYEPYVVSFSPYQKEAGNVWSPDIFPQEYSFFGSVSPHAK